MISELKLYDFQGIIPLPKENMDAYSRRAQRTQLLLKEFYDWIRSSVETHNYGNLPISLSKDPKVEFLDSVSIPEYGFDDPIYPIISLDEKSFRKNTPKNASGIHENFKYKGMKLPFILIKEESNSINLKKHEEFHGIRAPFEKNIFHPDYTSNHTYTEHLAGILSLVSIPNTEKDFPAFLQISEYLRTEDLRRRNLALKLSLPLSIASEVLVTVVSFNLPIALFSTTALITTFYLIANGEYAVRKLEKINPSIENIKASTNRPILPLLARITHDELFDISNGISDGKSLDRIMEEKENGKYGYRWKIIHDRL